MGILLNYESLMLIQKTPSTGKEFSYPKGKSPLVPPGDTTVQKIIKALIKDIALTVSELVIATGVSTPTVYRALKFMGIDGLVVSQQTSTSGGRAPARYNLTGVDVSGILSEVVVNPRPMQSNNTSGITGVHFNIAAQKWIVTYGRGKNYRFDNLLDAACKRKSLELV